MGERFAGGLAAWVEAVQRRAGWMLAASALLAALCVLYAASRLTVTTATGALVAPDAPFQRDFRDFKAAFPMLSDTIVAVIDGRTPDHALEAASRLVERLRARPALFRDVFAPAVTPFFARSGFLYLDPGALGRVADRLAGAQPLLGKLAGDPSLRGLFAVLAEAAEAAAGGEAPAAALADTYRRVAATLETVAAGRPEPLSWMELVEPDRGTAAERRQIVVVKPALEEGVLAPAAPAMAAIRDAAAALGLTPENGVRVRLTGGAALDTEELESVTKGASLAGVLSFALVALVLVGGMRAPGLTLAVLLTLVIGLAWTAGFATLAVGRLNLISVAFAVLFIGLAVDFGIHLALRYGEARAGGKPTAPALAEAAQAAGPAVTLCALAAAAGFLAFVPTDFVGLAELGVISGGGMVLALAASLTVLPALIALIDPRPPRAASARTAPERLIVRHRRAVSLAALALAAAAAALAPQARFEANPIALMDPSAESVRAFADLLHEGEQPPYTIEAAAPDLAAARALAARLDALPEVDRAVTLADFVPADQDAKLATIDAMALFLGPVLEAAAPLPPPDDAARRASADNLRARLGALAEAAPTLAPAARRLGAALDRLRSPEALRTAETALLRFLPLALERLRAALGADRVSLESLPERLRRRYLAPDGPARIEVVPAFPLDGESAMRRFSDAVTAVAPHATGAPVTIVASRDAVVASMRQATATAALVVLALLLAVLRRLRATLLVLAPVAMAGAFTVAASVLLDRPFNFANVIVLPLLLGLGVASGIHIVLRTAAEAAGRALLETSTPRAVTLSALTTVASFGSLAVSGHRGLASMGELLTVAVGFTLLSALVVLPALMAWLGPSPRRSGAGGEGGTGRR